MNKDARESERETVDHKRVKRRWRDQRRRLFSIKPRRWAEKQRTGLFSHWDSEQIKRGVRQLAVFAHTQMEYHDGRPTHTQTHTHTYLQRRTRIRSGDSFVAKATTITTQNRGQLHNKGGLQHQHHHIHIKSRQHTSPPPCLAKMSCLPPPVSV